MKTRILALTSGAGNTVPRCWAADSPNQQVDEGVFILTMPTANHSAEDVTIVI